MNSFVDLYCSRPLAADLKPSAQESTSAVKTRISRSVCWRLGAHNCTTYSCACIPCISGTQKSYSQSTITPKWSWTPEARSSLQPVRYSPGSSDPAAQEQFVVNLSLEELEESTLPVAEQRLSRPLLRSNASERTRTELVSVTCPSIFATTSWVLRSERASPTCPAPSSKKNCAEIRQMGSLG